MKSVKPSILILLIFVLVGCSNQFKNSLISNSSINQELDSASFKTDQNTNNLPINAHKLDTQPRKNLQKLNIKASLNKSDCLDGVTGSAKLEIYYNDQVVKTLSLPSCLYSQAEVLASSDNEAYITVKPTEIGGQIYYGQYANLYQINISTNQLTEIFDDNYLTDITFSQENEKIVYLSGSDSSRKLLVKNLPSGEIKLYELPHPSAQVGNFVFSPDLLKIAFEEKFGYGFDEVSVYILNLTDGQHNLYKSGQQLRIISWDSGNDYPLTAIPLK